MPISSTSTKSPLAAAQVPHVGIDIGSTTTKYVVYDPSSGAILASDYTRHHARQAQSVQAVLRKLAEEFPQTPIRLALCGSGGNAVAQFLGVPFIQEVVANSIAIGKYHSSTRCAIELGGQDAKMLFFREDPSSETPVVSDMRMNGSCAGGTGAFIDEIATLLSIPIEEFDSFAARGRTVYDISGRCGVYAKTDIQPLLNQGATREDLALSTFHAIAKQTLGGLAQGLDIVPPVIFEGGPLTFNPTLVRVFAERLGLNDDQVIHPERPETIVALGTALSLVGMFADRDATIDPLEAIASLDAFMPAQSHSVSEAPFFGSLAERSSFERRLADGKGAIPETLPPGTLNVYLGIDSGSTTTKFALVDEDENLVGEFYASNEGEPLEVARRAVRALREDVRRRGAELDVIAVGTTGYGEDLFAKAVHADYHAVETVAHARAATKYVPDATFILDIGGQDMKAIWLKDGVITDIVVNEACSSGCGSFLESFAMTLGIPVEKIAEAAFRSGAPAALGSRCTVFMNSSIVTEQRNGKLPDDIMAGLCRSIIENVFTKVVRVPNMDSLGKRIVVQGGTFRNDAVVRALEQRVGHEVTRSPYPGVMGAIGVALLTKGHVEQERYATGEEYVSSFIGLDAMESLTYTRESNMACPFCQNHCQRTVIRFSDGATHVTGNRCERGEIVGDPHDDAVRQELKARLEAANAGENLFDLRERLLFKEYKTRALCPDRGVTIGIPRVLSFWDNAPFWTTFFRSLGFSVRLSPTSSRHIYEASLPKVASDTVCFPAKLVHGHVAQLAQMGVDRVFMPIVTTVPSENTESTSQSMCAVVKGYPMVIRNSDNPASSYGVAFDDPLFHWYTDRDRERQLCDYMQREMGVDPVLTKDAIRQGDQAMEQFRTELVSAGSAAIEKASTQGTYAIVLASRPYHNDSLVNHGLPRMISSMGISVLPPDAVPGIEDVDLSRSRLDVVNNFHARMLSSAIIAAQRPELEYVQLVSFGCGHDAYLSDEIVRLMREISGKAPLVLKVDESDATGPLRIRLRSFVETVNLQLDTGASHPVQHLADPYPVKFSKEERREKVLLVPNTSHAFSRLMAVAFSRQGVRAEPLEVGREEAIALGKKYVHNDICFPAQMTIGESLHALMSGRYDGTDVAIATGKYIGDCRLTHYGALLRKALDDAGFASVPIVTNDDVDYHDLHPGFKLSVPSALLIATGLPMIDALEALLRRMRPYELIPGSADHAFEEALDALITSLRHRGIPGAAAGFSQAIDIMGKVKYDRSNPRPRVLIVGEYLLNFHPGANHDIEAYLERNGLEIVEARMTDVIRKSYFYKHAQVREYKVDVPWQNKVWYAVADRAFDVAHALTDRIGSRHPLYEPAVRMPDLVKASDPIMHHTFDAGEGVLIPAEILHHAERGCRTFVILQPFGCLPNHVCGRGISKRLKELYPDAQILPLDYDPDVSFANIENRLQMLVMNAKDA